MIRNEWQFTHVICFCLFVLIFEACIQVWYITSIIPCDCKLDTVIIIWLIGGDRAISSKTLAKGKNLKHNLFGLSKNPRHGRITFYFSASGLDINMSPRCGSKKLYFYVKLLLRKLRKWMFWLEEQYCQPQNHWLEIYNQYVSGNCKYLLESLNFEPSSATTALRRKLNLKIKQISRCVKLW